MHVLQVQKRLVMGGLVVAAAAAGVNKDRTAAGPLALSAALSAASVALTVLVVQPLNASLAGAVAGKVGDQGEATTRGELRRWAPAPPRIWHASLHPGAPALRRLPRWVGATTVGSAPPPLGCSLLSLNHVSVPHAPPPGRYATLSSTRTALAVLAFGSALCGVLLLGKKK